MQAPAVSRTPIRWKQVLSWALYDFANTIFSMNIVSLYFSLWVIHVMGGKDIQYSIANGTSMALILLTAPLLGALSDQAGRRMPFLVASTLLCVLFTALLGMGGLLLSLAFFVLANYGFQAGLIFYDALLPEVSDESNVGVVGGIGIGLGYLGSFTGVAMGLLVLNPDRPETYLSVFRLTALLFLLFALPCFLFVRERRKVLAESEQRSVGEILRGSLTQLKRTVEHAQEFPGLARFLLGRVFYTDPVNTVILFMSVYVVKEVGFSETEAQIFLLFAITAAAVGSFLWGPIVDRIGPKRSLNWVLRLWMVVFAGAILLAIFDLKPAFWLVGALAGIALGGTWAADRPYMLRLAPPRYIGEFYGLYSMVGRFASIVGPLMWGFVVDVLGWGRPAAVATLLVLVVIAYGILQPVSDEPRQWPPELQVQVAD